MMRDINVKVFRLEGETLWVLQIRGGDTLRHAGDYVELTVSGFLSFDEAALAASKIIAALEV